MSSITGLNKTLQTINKAVNKRRLTDVIDRLSEIGYENAKVAYDLADYVYGKDVKVTVKKIRDGKAVVARGKSVLFIEYGSGIRYGYGHPEPGQYGPSTWSEGPNGSGHWDNPNGWTIPGTRIHTYGNPPAMAMYEAGKEIRRNIPSVVKGYLK